jgi:hypothetical protein
MAPSRSVGLSLPMLSRVIDGKMCPTRQSQ